MKVDREIELKLEVSPEALAKMKEADPEEGFLQGNEEKKHLNSLYFDTPDQDLRNRKISLRVREKGPNDYVQTLKLGTGLKGGLSTAFEIERPVRDRALDFSAIDDAKALATLIEAIGGKPLNPVFETVIDRTTRIVSTDNDDQIEVAFDEGEVVAGEQRAPFAELELELQKGSAEALFSAAQWISGSTPFRFSPFGKAERGFRLTAGELEDSGPRPATKVKITANQTTEHAFSAILASCLSQIADNRMAVLASDEPEGPHQLRVGLRRLRSAFRLFRPLLSDDTWAAGLNAEARELAAKVATQRDLDVLMDEVVAPMQETMPETVKADSLLASLKEQREGARKALLEDLTQVHWNRFLLMLTAYISIQGWRENASETTLKRWDLPIQMFADEALAKQWKRVAGFGKSLETLDIAQRHEMRKALKKLRYGLEFFAPLYAGHAYKSYLKQLKKLQNVFGYLNDVAMAERLLDLFDTSDRHATFTIGYCLATHTGVADAEWGRAKGLWQALDETKPVWK